MVPHPALLPLTVPMVPFLVAAGVMQYPERKFVASLTLVRISRYMVLAYLAERYGHQINAVIAEHGHPVPVAIISALMMIATAGFYFWRGNINKKRTCTIGELFF
jgi:membrane protein DedA with SNARE-associated domain